MPSSSAPGIQRIQDAADVDFSGVADGYVMVWDAGLSKFVMQAQSGGGESTGSAGDVQTADGSGGFAGDSNFAWDGSTLTLNGAISAASFAGDGSALTGVTATPTPAGSDTQLQINEAGVLGASSQLFWDGDSLNVLSTSTDNCFIAQAGINSTLGPKILFTNNDSTPGSSAGYVQAVSLSPFESSLAFGTGYGTTVTQMYLHNDGSLELLNGKFVYTPGNAGNWAGAAPGSVEEALDRLAAATPGA